VALSLFGPRIAVPNGGRYPPSHPVESGLSSVARPRAQAAGLVSQPCRLSAGAAAIIAPATAVAGLVSRILSSFLPAALADGEKLG